MSIQACGRDDTFHTKDCCFYIKERDEIGEVGRVLCKDLPGGGNFRSYKEKAWRETINFPNSVFFDIYTLNM